MLAGIRNPQSAIRNRFEHADTAAWAMVYRVVHDGPFRLQPEEIVRGEFVPLEEVAQRTTRDRFCPDGLKVLATYRQWLSADGGP